MNGQQIVQQMRKEEQFLHNIIDDFSTEQGDFAPAEGMMTVAQQIHHIAYTVDWFREGAFGAGFNMDFEALEAEVRRPITLQEALGELKATYDAYVASLEPMSEQELMAPMAPNPIFGEAPKVAVLSAQADHTAHHRGALSVYLRLLGITPKMIYAAE